MSADKIAVADEVIDKAEYKRRLKRAGRKGAIGGGIGGGLAAFLLGIWLDKPTDFQFGHLNPDQDRITDVVVRSSFPFGNDDGPFSYFMGNRDSEHVPVSLYFGLQEDDYNRVETTAQQTFNQRLQTERGNIEKAGREIMGDTASSGSGGSYNP
ncbi:hypothetical protein ACFL1B_01240 [Nanoarchaeota archaeon]